MTHLDDYTENEFEHAGLTVRIVRDIDPALNPRTDYDAPSTWYGEGGESSWAGGYCSAAEWIREKRLEGCSVIPVRYADYGSNGARLYEADLDDANGAFICDLATVRHEWGEGSGKYQGHNGARRYMRGEIAEMDQFLQGNVYGIVIGDETNDNIESVWGFIGEPDADWILSEARDLAEGVRDSIDADKAREDNERQWAARQEIATV